MLCCISNFHLLAESANEFSFFVLPYSNCKLKGTGKNCVDNFFALLTTYHPLLTVSSLEIFSKLWHFWSTYPHLHVNIVCERPLTYNASSVRHQIWMTYVRHEVPFDTFVYYHSTYYISWGVNQSSLITPFLMQIFLNLFQSHFFHQKSIK